MYQKKKVSIPLTARKNKCTYAVYMKKTPPTKKFSRRVWTDYPIENAYELVEVSETRSFDEIKTSFRKLAEETHPDLAESRNDSTASR
ncbi:hypothetical protein QL285_023696 [Trifolium repens]|nr:hypothetical protein QL285_023696 [Trifolium repens]